MATLITIAEAADIFGQSPQYINNIITEHKIKTVKKKVVKREQVIKRVNIRHVDIAALEEVFKDAKQ